MTLLRCRPGQAARREAVETSAEQAIADDMPEASAAAILLQGGAEAHLRM